MGCQRNQLVFVVDSGTSSLEHDQQDELSLIKGFCENGRNSKTQAEFLNPRMLCVIAIPVAPCWFSLQSSSEWHGIHHVCGKLKPCGW